MSDDKKAARASFSMHGYVSAVKLLVEQRHRDRAQLSVTVFIPDADPDWYPVLQAGRSAGTTVTVSNQQQQIAAPPPDDLADFSRLVVAHKELCPDDRLDWTPKGVAVTNKYESHNGPHLTFTNFDECHRWLIGQVERAKMKKIQMLEASIQDTKKL